MIKRLGRLPQPAVKRCMALQTPETGGLTTHSVVVEWERVVPSAEPGFGIGLRERMRDHLSTAAGGCDEVEIAWLSCCGYDADGGIGVWTGAMKLGHLAGDRDLLNDLKRDFADVRPHLGQ